MIKNVYIASVKTLNSIPVKNNIGVLFSNLNTEFITLPWMSTHICQFFYEHGIKNTPGVKKSEKYTQKLIFDLKKLDYTFTGLKQFLIEVNPIIDKLIVTGDNISEYESLALFVCNILNEKPYDYSEDDLWEHENIELFRYSKYNGIVLPYEKANKEDIRKHLFYQSLTKYREKLYYNRKYIDKSRPYELVDDIEFI